MIPNNLLRITGIPVSVVLVFLLCIPPGVRSATAGQHALRLSEIYPAPAGDTYEWVEVRNTGTEALSLSDYSVRDASGKRLMLTEGQLLPGEYAIATGSGILNNGGDTVTLSDTLGTDLESVTYSGTFDATRSYASCPATGEWSIGTSPTRAAANLTACPTPTSFPSPSVPLAPTATPGTSTPAPSSSPAPTAGPAGDPGPLRISEIMAAPEPGAREWVELYNPTERDVSLIGWYIDDGPGGGTPVSLSGTISPDGYRLVELPTAILNNGGDLARLLPVGTTPTGTDAVAHDSLPYDIAERGFSVGRTHPGASVCTMTPSPGQPNLPCREETGRSSAGSVGSAPENTTTSATRSVRKVSATPRPYSSTARSNRTSPSSARKASAPSNRERTSPTPQNGHNGRSISVEVRQTPTLSNLLGWASFALSLLAGGLTGARMRDIPLWP